MLERLNCKTTINGFQTTLSALYRSANTDGIEEDVRITIDEELRAALNNTEATHRTDTVRAIASDTTMSASTRQAAYASLIHSDQLKPQDVLPRDLPLIVSIAEAKPSHGTSEIIASEKKALEEKSRKTTLGAHRLLRNIVAQPSFNSWSATYQMATNPKLNIPLPTRNATYSKEEHTVQQRANAKLRIMLRALLTDPENQTIHDYVKASISNGSTNPRLEEDTRNLCEEVSLAFAKRKVLANTLFATY